MIPLVRRGLRGAARDRSVADAVRLVDDGGCPACLRRASSERQWISAFANETNADLEVQAELARTRGFCPAHTRTLMARTDASMLLPAVFASVIAPWLESPTGTTPGNGCPVCRSDQQAERDVLGGLGAVLDTPKVTDALLDQLQMCLPHAFEVLPLAPPQPARGVLDACAKHLLAVDGAQLVEFLVGHDPDVAQRTLYLKVIAAELPERDYFAARRLAPELLLDRLDERSCLACRDGFAGAVRYLRWLAEAVRTTPEKLDPLETSLCGLHLRDLEVLDDEAAPRVADRERDVLTKRIERLRSALATSSARGIRSCLNAFHRSGRECAACKAQRTAAARTSALVAAGATDRRTRDRLSTSHGACVVHGPGIASAAGDSLPADVLRARLRMIAWELEESRRKRSWWTRHEPQGPEMSSWRLAPTWLVGSAYLGLDAAAASPS